MSHRPPIDHPSITHPPTIYRPSDAHPPRIVHPSRAHLAHILRPSRAHLMPIWRPSASYLSSICYLSATYLPPLYRPSKFSYPPRIHHPSIIYPQHSLRNRLDECWKSAFHCWLRQKISGLRMGACRKQFETTAFAHLGAMTFHLPQKTNQVINLLPFRKMKSLVATARRSLKRHWRDPLHLDVDLPWQPHLQVENDSDLGSEKTALQNPRDRYLEVQKS